MARPGAIIQAVKSIPSGARGNPMPSAWGNAGPAAAANMYQRQYGTQQAPFMPRPADVFASGAFGPMPPTQPVPIDNIVPGGSYPDQRLWPFPVGWNLPTPPGTEGLKLACYSADTEILTRRGWLAFPELRDDDEVATRNPHTKAFEWQQPAARHSYDYDGELIRFKSRGIDLLVTPNHRILHMSGHGKNRSELIKRADECELLRSGTMIATSRWDAPDLDWWHVPESRDHGYAHIDVAALRGAREHADWTREQLAEKAETTARAILRMELGTGKLHVATMPRVRAICEILGIPPDRAIRPGWLEKIGGDDFAAFMGAYISEGCVSASSSGNLRIFIAQDRKSKGFGPYRELLIRMLGREPYYDGRSWTFNHDGLAGYLLQCGSSAPEKRIPADVLDMSGRQLRILLDFYRLGDGWTQGNSEAFTTTSRELAGQLQEVAQKIGLSASISRREVKSAGVIRGRLIKSSCPRYDVFLRTTKNPKWTSTERVGYEGSVHCVTVPNGIIYVRRNGRAVWSGNSFDQLRTLSEKYSVARAAIELRIEEIRGLEWDIALTTDAEKAYRNDVKSMRDFGERKAKLMRFFRHPDPDFWSFDTFLNALLEEIFVYDALSIVFRPKYGEKIGMKGRGLLGSPLDCLQLVSGPTIRPLVGMHGEHPRPPSPAFQQYLYGVPRSDIPTIARGTDIEDYGLTGSEVNQWDSNMMLYAPYWPKRESPYGSPPVERALLPIISGLQKQEFQLDYFTEGCCSFDSEILTRNGWKFFTDLSENDEVATRSEKGVFEWQIPTEYHEYQYDGDLLRFRNRYIDALVTPSHRMLVKRPESYVRKQPGALGQDWHMRPAAEIARTPGAAWEIPFTSRWEQKECPDEFILPDENNGHGVRPGVRMQIEAFCAVLGIFLAEGCVNDRKTASNGRRRDVVIEIAQADNSRHLGEIQDITDATGMNWKYRNAGPDGRFYCTSATFGRWLKENCGHGAMNKRIPQWVKNLPAHCLEALLNGMMIGDGHWRTSGLRQYPTASRQLADDVHEIFQKLGADAAIHVYHGKPHWKQERKNPVYRVEERAGSGTHWLPAAEPTEYHGKVYCVTVPNGTILTRRNNKAWWGGNSVPAVYISPGDANITPTQIRELQDALNAIAGDPAYHMKVMVLPPGSKVEPQRPIDLSDSFDYLVMNQVLMAFDVQPTELGILPNIGGGAGATPSASAMRFGAQEKRDIKGRTSTKPLLKFLCDIFNMVIQDICDCHDMQFRFEGLIDDEDKQAITELGVKQVQNGISSIDEVRERLDQAPWGMKETSEPVVFTAQGPVPFSMAPELIRAAITGQAASGQGTNSGQSSPKKSKQPRIRQGGQTKPNGSHPAPVSPHREAPATPAHAAAAAAIQSPTPRTGGTTGRSSVAGSRKKAVLSELGALRRLLRKDRDVIFTWEPRHVDSLVLARIADDLAVGVLVDVAVDKQVRLLDTVVEQVAAGLGYIQGNYGDVPVRSYDSGGYVPPAVDTVKAEGNEFPGWEHDLGLVGRYKQEISQAFQDAEIRGQEIRKDAATGNLWVSNNVMLGMISEEVRKAFTDVMTPMWAKAWNLGYGAGVALVTGKEAVFDPAWETVVYPFGPLQDFLNTEGVHWLDQVAKTGLGNSNARSEVIARTEVARAMNAGALQAYKDHGVSHKHLLVSPDDACDICVTAEAQGIIPIDAVFPKGGLGGPFHPQCVIGSTRVSAQSQVRGASVRDYVGEFVTIRTAFGNELTATPNHPVATRRGWVPISELKVGDNVLRSTRAHRPVESVYPDVNDVPPRIEDVAHSLPVTFATVPVSPEDFHGDGSGSEVCVVRTDSLLVGDGNSFVFQEGCEDDFSSGNVAMVSPDVFDTLGDLSFGAGAFGDTTNRSVSRSGESESFFRGGSRHASVHALTAVPGSDVSIEQALPNYGTADSEGFCERLLTLSPEIALDEIADVKRDVLATHVYNLEVDDGWYIANSIVTHNCRCVPGPAGVDFVPPQAHLGKNAREDSSRLAWVLLRAEGDDGKYRFLLQQRDDGTWGMPGGTPHVGEDPWAAAYRETTEEIGDLPETMKCVRTFHHVEDDVQVYLYMCDVPFFRPKLNGSTPEETRGAAWFKRKEIGDLHLAPKFREDWEKGVCLKDNVTKSISGNVSGEILVDSAQGGGARWPYPRRPSGTSGDPVEGPDDRADEGQAVVYGDDEGDEFPGRRGKPGGPGKFPDQGGRRWPDTSDGGPQAGIGGKQGGRPVTGSVPAKTPEPADPHVVEPEALDPGDLVEQEGPEGENLLPDPVRLPEVGKGAAEDVRLADPGKPGGPSDYSDPNPVNPEHVMNLMRSNFPEDAIGWVMKAKWVGPVQVPWERIDTDSVDSWAASHQPDAVNRFARDIKAGTGHTNPSVLIQDDDSAKAIIIDGHHRALARHKLGQPVLSYLGILDPGDRQAAEETHSKQVHHGADPRNKGADSPKG